MYANLNYKHVSEFQLILAAMLGRLMMEIKEEIEFYFIVEATRNI